MRDPIRRICAIALIGGLALAVSACGGRDEADNATVANDLDSNLMLDAPANDASAMESVVNTAEPLPAENATESASNESDVLGDTSGGDTGGNTVESNVSGM